MHLMDRHLHKQIINTGFGYAFDDSSLLVTARHDASTRETMDLHIYTYTYIVIHHFIEKEGLMHVKTKMKASWWQISQLTHPFDALYALNW